MTDNNEIAGQDLDHLLPFHTPRNYPLKPPRLDAELQRKLRGDLNIYQRINEIKKHCATVEKDIEQEGKNWAGVSLGAVIEQVRNKMIAYGVLTRITLIKSKLKSIGEEPQIGFERWVHHGEFSVQFINIDNPSDLIMVVLDGHSIGDNAAMLSSWTESQIFKRALLKMFNIITEENEEPLKKTNKIEKEYPAEFGSKSVSLAEMYPEDRLGFDQITAMNELLLGRGITRDRLCETFDIQSLEDMKIKDYKKAIELIEKM